MTRPPWPRRSRRWSRSAIRRRCRCSSRWLRDPRRVELEDEGGTEGDATIGELVSEALNLLAKGALVTVHPSGEHRLAVRPSRPPPAHVRLGPAEAAIFETFVVPRYMSLFGELALEMIADSDDAQVVHLHCRTGYPDRGMAIRLPGALHRRAGRIRRGARAGSGQGGDDARKW